MKKLFITLGLLSLVIFLIKTYYDLRGNLIHYSVYYAQNLDHDPDYDPVMAMVVDNLDYIPRLEDDSIHYDFDGHSTIYNANYEIYVTKSSEKYLLSKNEELYYFTEQGEFSHYRIYASDSKFDDSSDQRKMEAKKYVAEILEPLIAIQPEPPKGEKLQWLFNITYGRRFQ
ncbi:hypothetical protein [Streptococcus danieliae]|uniref:Uncharacterized protein n=1 Tax=Streptococcus danieliae TaxID=747656 RepID=A0A7Z0M8H3_9STRE|nr:hypothetical protein [Streptococcus danieliae]MBF0700141.1 hypothetical protein [Streptococcus danieliae]NYS97317.1 hypothetical protein [Streptococcus danieliae]